MKIKELVNNIESKKTCPHFNVGFLIVLFVLGWLGIKLIAIVSQLAILLPVANDFKILETLDTNIFNNMVTLVNAICLFIYYFICFAIFLIIVVVKKDALKYLKQCLNKPAILFGIKMAVIMFLANYVYSVISSFFYNGTSNDNQEAINSVFNISPFLTFFAICIFAPVCEELTYRLGLFTLCSKKSRILAYVITVLTFALIHFTYSSKDIINELWNLPSYLLGAYFLSYTYDKNGNIISSITAHAVYNFIGYVFMLIGSFAA